MAEITESAVRGVLETVIDPASGRSVVALGMVSGIATRGGHVAVTLDVDPARGAALEPLRQACEQAVRAMPGVLSATAVMTAERAAPKPTPPPQRPHAHGQAPGGGRIDVPGVKHIIAVASGKGGVGKSTTAVNLALGLAANGVSTGLLDADIYGPSVPGLTGTQDQPKVVDEKLVPLRSYGLQLMSIGFLGGADKAMIWRGPMVSRAIQQMMSDVAWGELDYLVIDLPPGTGDASLTIAQSVPLTGVAIVATPQALALDIAVKALQMFRSLNVTPLGLIENMSWYVCPECGHEHHVFGHGGAERAARRLGVPFLGALPLAEDIRVESDSGAPIVVSRPDSPAARAFADVASQIAARTSIQSFRRLPVINIR